MLLETVNTNRHSALIGIVCAKIMTSLAPTQAGFSMLIRPSVKMSLHEKK
jgi:hypothetical protein